MLPNLLRAYDRDSQERSLHMQVRAGYCRGRVDGHHIHSKDAAPCTFTVGCHISYLSVPQVVRSKVSAFVLACVRKHFPRTGPFIFACVVLGSIACWLHVWSCRTVFVINVLVSLPCVWTFTLMSLQVFKLLSSYLIRVRPSVTRKARSLSIKWYASDISGA